MSPIQTAEVLTEQFRTLPPQERRRVVEATLRQLTPDERNSAERLLRRLQNPDVPEDVWEGFEECEDGKAIEMKDEHFTHPPV